MDGCADSNVQSNAESNAGSGAVTRRRPHRLGPTRQKNPPETCACGGRILLPAGRNSGNRIRLFPRCGWTGCLVFRLTSTQLGPAKTTSSSWRLSWQLSLQLSLQLSSRASLQPSCFSLIEFVTTDRAFALSFPCCTPIAIASVAAFGLTCLSVQRVW